YLFFIAIGLFLVFVTLASPLIFKWIINSEFSDGASYVFWIGISYWFWGGYLILSNYIFYLKKTKILGYIAVVNVIVNLTLNYFLIDRYGPIGAAYATAIAFFTVFVIVAIVANKMYPMPWLKFRTLLKK
ncbi:MAG: polysaccharide biosynthesis C-terminal domain-containing protein, partial [Bacteroidota bacterium]